MTSLVCGRPTPASICGLRATFSPVCERIEDFERESDVAAFSPRKSKEAEGTCTSKVGLSNEFVVAEGASIGEKGSLYFAPCIRRGKAGDVGEG